MSRILDLCDPPSGQFYNLPIIRLPVAPDLSPAHCFCRWPFPLCLAGLWQGFAQQTAAERTPVLAPRRDALQRVRLKALLQEEAAWARGEPASVPQWRHATIDLQRVYTATFLLCRLDSLVSRSRFWHRQTRKVNGSWDIASGIFARAHCRVIFGWSCLQIYPI